MVGLHLHVNNRKLRGYVGLVLEAVFLVKACLVVFLILHDGLAHIWWEGELHLQADSSSCT